MTTEEEAKWASELPKWTYMELDAELNRLEHGRPVWEMESGAWRRACQALKAEMRLRGPSA